jgi:hypothetical protein
MTYRGTIRRGVVVLEDGAALPEGTQVVVATVERPADKRPVTAAPKAGSAKGKVRMSPDFDEHLPDFAEYME